MKKALIHITLLIFIFCQYGLTQSSEFDIPIKGISVLGPHQAPYHPETFQELKITHSNWVALIPEATLDRETLTLHSDDENDHWGSTIAAQIEGVRLAKAAGLNVFLKPHIVLEPLDETLFGFRWNLFSKNKDKTNGAEWRGTFKAVNEADWKLFEQTYESYILELAAIAESLEVELFSVGTEMREAAVQRPMFWRKLIEKVRGVYSGMITYSANWDEFDQIPFWDGVDYIGIDAYFPVNPSKTPSIEETVKNWKPIKRQLKGLSHAVNKKILMTEFGYRNISYSGQSPWLHDEGKARPNDQAQANLYEAFFRTFWNESWVAGGFSWNWQHGAQHYENTDFTVQNKPAFWVLKRWYM